MAFDAFVKSKAFLAKPWMKHTATGRWFAA